MNKQEAIKLLRTEYNLRPEPKRNYTAYISLFVLSLLIVVAITVSDRNKEPVANTYMYGKCSESTKSVNGTIYKTYVCKK